MGRMSNLPFANDGSFMAQFLAQQAAAGSSSGSYAGGREATVSSKDIDRSPLLGRSADAPAPTKERPRFTEEPDERGASASRSKRKFVEADEFEPEAYRSAAPRAAAAQPDLDGEAYDPAADAAAGAGAAAAEQDELVLSAWGKKYKAGFVPQSSHVGNLLPAEDLAKYTTLLPGRKPVEEKKEEKEKTVLDSSNAGYKMLSKMGWKAGKGLGAKEDGKVAPVGAQKAASDKSGAAAGSAHGVGSQHTWDLDGSEDVFEQYRKRMMLGYRHRPNPNGNPRKLYY